MLCLPETACTNFSTCVCKGFVDYNLNLEVCFVFIVLTGVWQNQCSNSEETDILFFFIFYLSQFLDIFDFYTIHPSFLLLKCPAHLQWQHFELHAWHEFQYFIIESFTVLHNYNTVLNLTGFLLVSCNSWKFCLLSFFFWIDLHEYAPILHTSSRVTSTTYTPPQKEVSIFNPSLLKVYRSHDCFKASWWPFGLLQLLWLEI